MTAEQGPRLSDSARAKMFAVSVAAVALLAGAAPAAGPRQDAPPRILLDQPLRAVEYQLDRLSNEQLVRVERRADDPRYRPVYMAILTRRGLAPEYVDEAVAALVAIDATSAAAVLLEAIGRVSEDEAAAAAALARRLLAQPGPGLRQTRDVLAAAIAVGTPGVPTPGVTTPGVPTPGVLRAAYGALLMADGNPTAAWDTATSREGHLARLLESVPLLPAGPAADAVRGQLVAPITGVIDGAAADTATRAAALTALAAVRPDGRTFAVLADEVQSGTALGARAAAARALLLLPDSAWPSSPDALGSLADGVTSRLRALPADQRTDTSAIDLLQLGERAAARLPAARGAAVRRDLRALGVQVVRVSTVPDQLTFDRRWFVVEAGKPVQIVLVNPDAMPHNLVIGAPGSLEAIGTAGSAMPMSSDPAVKPFVPALPAVIASTRLLAQGESERLAFTAPSEPGTYIYVCTFPGHWLRMYGVMLVVPDLEAFDRAPTPPNDPMTGQPLPKRN